MADSDRLNYPGAPPDKVRGAIETLFLEWQSVQAERAQWKLERSQLRARIIQLESEARNHEKVRLDLIRRIKLLEHGLLSERMNYVSDAAPSKFASNFAVNGVSGKPGRSESRLVPHGHPTGKGRFYRTLPSDFLASPNSYLRNMSPGRQFLREYLIELGYIKEAEQLDPRHSGIVESKFEQEPVKLPSSSSKSAISISVKREALPSDSEWAAGSNSPDKPKGSYAKPNVKPTSVTAARRGSADALLLEQKSGDSKRWKSTVSLRSHMDSVRCISWHSTEAAIVTGSEDGTAKFWNLSDEISLAPNKKKKANPLEPNYTFRGHRGMVTSVVLADQLKRIFTAGTDSKIFVWDVPPLNLDTYDELGRATRFRRQVLEGHKDAVWNMCVHPVAAQGLLFSASSDSTIATWKIDGDNPIKLINQTAHIDSKNHLTSIPTSLTVMNSDMKRLLVGFKSGEVGQVDIETGKVIRVMHSAVDTNATSSSNTGNFHINDIVSHPSLSLAITAHVDNNVRIFDVSQGSCVSVMQTHRDAVTSVALDPSGLYLASASHDQSLRFWDISSKKIIQDLDGYQTHRSKYDEAIHMVRYHPSMPVVATCGADSFAKVYQ